MSSSSVQLLVYDEFKFSPAAGIASKQVHSIENEMKKVRNEMVRYELKRE